MARVATDTKRVMLNIPTELLKAVDEYAHKMNVNRTSAICFLLSQSLTEKKALIDIGELVELMRDRNNADNAEHEASGDFSPSQGCDGNP